MEFFFFSNYFPSSKHTFFIFSSTLCFDNEKFRSLAWKGVCFICVGLREVIRYLQVLLELAKNRNKIPLPRSIAEVGIPLPPEQDTLISPNYQLAIPRRQSSQAVEETEDEDEAPPNPPQPKTEHTPPQRVSFPLAKRAKFN